MIRARGGDVDAFQHLVEAYAPSAFRLASAIVGESAASDVVQDAFVQAWRGLRGLRDPERFGPWLYRIVANRARSIRRSDRHVRQIPLDRVAVHAIPSASDDLGAAETRVVIETAFQHLSVDHRTVIGLHYGAGLPLHDVAEVLGIPIGTAKSRLSAALTALRLDVGGR